MLENNDKKLFIEKFDEISNWLGPFGEQAMQESSCLINRLIERI